jgi:hypothetical protein
MLKRGRVNTFGQNVVLCRFMSLYVVSFLHFQQKKMNILIKFILNPISLNGFFYL